MIYQPLRDSKERKGKWSKAKEREGKLSYDNFGRIQSKIVASRIQ